LLNIETNNIVKQEQDSTEETGDETIVNMADPAEEIVSSDGYKCFFGSYD
jgi:hypothetical protein